jgi:hypothetical protein
VAALAGCGQAPHTPFQPCDVQQSACQVRTFLALEERRGQLWDPWAVPPPVAVISREVLRRWLGSGGGDDVWDNSLRALDLLPPNLDATSADQLWRLENGLAFYWSERKLVTFVEGRVPPGELAAVSMLTHEYAHAAQDREFGIAAPGPLTTDLDLVRTSLIEGEAEFYGTLARLEMEATDPASFDWAANYRHWLSNVRSDILFVASAHTHLRLSMPYPAGGWLIASAWLSGRTAGVNRVFLDPPRSFLGLMRVAEGLSYDVPLAPRCTLPADRPGYIVADVDTLGAGLFYAFLARLSGREADSWQAALTWRGDQIWVVQNATSRNMATLWRVHAPGLRASPLGPILEAQPGPPVLEGDNLIFWSGDEAAQQLRRTLVCPD